MKPADARQRTIADAIISSSFKYSLYVQILRFV